MDRTEFQPFEGWRPRPGDHISDSQITELARLRMRSGRFPLGMVLIGAVVSGTLAGVTGLFLPFRGWLAGVLIPVYIAAGVVAARRMEAHWARHKVFEIRSELSRCLNCGYDLYHISSEQCPECGTSRTLPEPGRVDSDIGDIGRA